MIYFDNSATTSTKPRRVLKAFYNGIKKYSFNAGRGGHDGSVRAGLEIYKTRESLKNFFNAKSTDNVIFTHNCTAALNLAILGSSRLGGHVVTTYQEHNSVLRPLKFLEQSQGITYAIVYPKRSDTLEITLDDIKKHVKHNTYMVIINHTSNITGNTINIEEIGKFCKKNKLLLLVDGAQSAGHIKIDMRKQNINMLAIAGHKGLYGPQGVGALITNAVRLQPIMFGGTGTKSLQAIQPHSSPDGFEAGTQAVANIKALREGVEFVDKNFDKINERILEISTFILDELRKIDEVKLISENAKSGVISFTVDDIQPNEIGNLLNEKYSIYVRCGLHCAPLVHKYCKTAPCGAIRVSLSYYNTKKEALVFISALREIISNYEII